MLIALPAALVAAILDVNVYIVLIGGTFFAGIVGILTNGMTPLTFIQSLSTGTRNCRIITIQLGLMRTEEEKKAA